MSTGGKFSVVIIARSKNEFDAPRPRKQFCRLSVAKLGLSVRVGLHFKALQ